MRCLPRTSHKQALDLVRNSGPVDVVITDISMPDMLGTQLVRKIAQVSPQTASMLMTAGVIDSTEVSDGLRVLRKPFRARDLMAAVQATLPQSA
jgi:CheY-like chemotaxis protein